jgi:hypothetical protein
MKKFVIQCLFLFFSCGMIQSLWETSQIKPHSFFFRKYRENSIASTIDPKLAESHAWFGIIAQCTHDNASPPHSDGTLAARTASA